MKEMGKERSGGGGIGGDWMRLFDSALLYRDGLVDSIALCVE